MGTYTLIVDIIFFLRDLMWSGPLLGLFIATGIYVTWQLRGIQFRYLKSLFSGKITRIFSDAIANDITHDNNISQDNDIAHDNDITQNDDIYQNNDTTQNNHAPRNTPKGEISSLQALMTALAGAIGTGNITGIAVAVTTGGFGALFWMWVIALFGMATAYAETVLAIRFRETNSNGMIIGGPMLTISRGLKNKWLATWFAICGAFAGLGYAMVQANSVVDATQSLMGIDRLSLGIILSLIAGWVIIGGVKRVGKVASTLVPFMALVYLSISLIVLAYNYEKILPAFYLIFTSAFTGQSAIGGFIGSTVMLAMQSGAQYGIFANEAGLGSFAIANSCAKTSNPEQQGLLAMGGVFVATMIVCTITGLVIAVTGVLGTEVSGAGVLTGSALALLAFSSVNTILPYLVIICLLLFAFTTILAWSYYGEKCIEFLCGVKVAYAYRWLYIISLILGAVTSLHIVWAFANLANGLMAIPNLIAIICLVKLLRGKYPLTNKQPISILDVS